MNWLTAKYAPQVPRYISDNQKISIGLVKLYSILRMIKLAKRNIDIFIKKKSAYLLQKEKFKFSYTSDSAYFSAESSQKKRNKRISLQAITA